MTRTAPRPPRRFVPQDGARDLAPHPQRMELTVAPHDVAMPPLCPNCGARAVQRVTVRKIFRRVHDESPNSYQVASMDIPLCAPCLRAHEAEVVRLTPRERVLGRFATEATIPAVVIGLTGLFFLKVAVERGIASPSSRDLVPLVIALVCLVIAAICAVNAWTNNARADIVPQTRITRAFDFSDEDHRLMTPSRWTYAMRDPEFADAFRAANAGREWTPDLVEERAARRYGTMAVIAAMVAAVGMLLWTLVVTR